MAPPAFPWVDPGDAAWEAAVREVAERPEAAVQLVRSDGSLRQRFAESYARLTRLSRGQRRRLQRRLRLSLAGVALLLALGLTSAPALAATITVDGTNCTLAQAITTANNGTVQGGCTQGDPTGADTINLTVNVGLTAALPQITSAITLEGNGYAITRDGGAMGSFSLLTVVTGGDLTLKQTTISGGSASVGAGIFNIGGTVTVQSSTLSNNTAVSGGCFFNSGGTVTVQSSTLSGNSASMTGGGIYNANGTLLVTQSTLSSNKSSNHGGGIFNDGGTVTVQASTLSGNSAYLGGGIHNSNGTVTVTGNSTLSGNSAGVVGGGIYNDGGTVTVQASTLSGNSAYYGGGILNYTGAVTVQDNSAISENTADSVGGGIANWSGAVTVQNSTLSGNSAGEGGGGIYNSSYQLDIGTLTVQSSTLSGNSAGADGGGISNYGGTVTVQATTLSGNTVSSAPDSNAFGGGIHNERGTVTVQTSTIRDNVAISSGAEGFASGGGLYNWDGVMVVQRSTISGNVASNPDRFSNAGGIYNASRLTVENSTISGNSATYGGGVYTGALLTVLQSTITGNSAGVAGGGGIYTYASGTVTVQNSIVALQATGGDCLVQAGATWVSDGYNIESGTSCGFTGTGDQQNKGSGDLNLGELGDNGGPTWTHGLGAGSVAIDAIPKDPLEANGCGSTLTVDQRDYARAGGAGKGGDLCDIGAYEYDSQPLAVVLAALSAANTAEGVVISWETVSELDNLGFTLYRSASAEGPERRLGFIPAQAPGGTAGFVYSYVDRGAAAGETVWYWLEDLDLAGQTTLHGPVSVAVERPTAVTQGGMGATSGQPGWLSWLLQGVQQVLAVFSR